MVQRKPARMPVTDTVLAHLIRARTVATGLGYLETSRYIERAICTVMSEHHAITAAEAVPAQPDAA
jgi:hypothetical protein